MSQAVWHPATEPNGNTACAKSFEKAKELFANEGYKSTCEAWSTVFNRSLNLEKIPGIINGTFTLSDAE